jgi:Domain of unknown function (DUF4129)
MSVKSRAESALLVLAILALFGLLALLIGSLDELTFQPGKRLPHEEVAEEDVALSQRSLPELSSKDRLYAAILGILTLISIVCVFIFRKLRRELLQYLFVLFAFVLPLMLGIMFFGQLFSNWVLRHPSGAIADPGPLIPESILANPPKWALALAAGAVSVLVLGLGSFLVLRWFAFRKYVDQRKTELAILKAEQEALAEQAADTAFRIRKGKPLQGEVIRCYQEMARLLSRRRNIKPTYLTAREFSDSLAELGILTEHIQQLTELFELVRYGQRDDRSMANEALACLDELQSEYGAKENCEAQD